MGRKRRLLNQHQSDGALVMPSLLNLQTPLKQWELDAEYWLSPSDAYLTECD